MGTEGKYFTSGPALGSALRWTFSSVGSAVSGRSSPCNLPVERQLQYVDDGEFLKTAKVQCISDWFGARLKLAYPGPRSFRSASALGIPEITWVDKSRSRDTDTD